MQLIEKSNKINKLKSGNGTGNNSIYKKLFFFISGTKIMSGFIGIIINTNLSSLEIIYIVTLSHCPTVYKTFYQDLSI